MDATENITRNATSAAIVLTRGEELCLIELSGKPDAVSQSMALLRAGFTHQGFVGLVAGIVKTAPCSPLDCECMFAMGRAAKTFAMLFSAPVDVEGDSVDWLTKLHALEDPRGAN